MPADTIEDNAIQEKKQLRIAFAMGGGVSLGTFSGGALTEALKLLMITAYTDEDKYDDVVIDVFSGASAGAIALGIMIRMMVGYEDKLHHLKVLDKYANCTDTASIKDEIWKNLNKEYANLGRITSDRQKEQIISCQIAQDFQEVIWVDKVDIEGLGNLRNKNRSLLNSGGLLSSEFLSEIADELIYPESGGKIEINHNSPINSRFLFSCTLTRLMSNQLNSFKQFESNFYDDTATEFLRELLPIVAKDGASSENHKDYRVFDIDLRSSKEGILKSNVGQPDRWVKVLNRQKHSEDTNQFSVHHRNTWKMITQTTLACGAFPFAFEPKALKRRAFELGEEQTSDQVYSYIDGGVLNNEPISEAFRLSSFMDATYSNDEFDRVVIFVDPSINHEKRTKETNVYKKYQVSEESGRTEERTSLQRIIDHLGPLVKVIRNQSTITELDKSSDTLDKFKKRDQLRSMYTDTVRLGFPKRWSSIKDPVRQEIIKNKIIEVATVVDKSINELQKRMSIPPAFPMKEQEVAKMLRNDSKKEFFSNQFHEKFGTSNKRRRLSGILLDPTKFIEKFPNMIQDYIIFLYFMMIDSSLDLIGKNSNYALLPIGPIIVKGGNPEQIELMGQPFSAFLGFFHEKMRKTDFERGRLSAYDILCKLNLVSTCMVSNGKLPQLDPREIDQIQSQARYFLEERVYSQLLMQNGTKTSNMSGYRWKFWEDIGVSIVARALKSKIIDASESLNLNQEKTLELEIRIKVSDKRIQVNHLKYKTEIRSKDIKPIRIDETNDLYLVLSGKFLYRRYGENMTEWKDSSFIKNNEIQIDVDGFWKDERAMKLVLPNDKIDEVSNKLYPIVSIDISDYSVDQLREEVKVDTKSKMFMEKWKIVEGKEAID